MGSFSKVLVANRGEIAGRVFRRLRARDRRRRGVLRGGPIAARSTSPRPTRPTSSGRGPPPRATSAAIAVIEAALRAGAQAIHPGHGFLAENAAFARQVAEAGLIWIGPPPEAIEAMGSKTAARELMPGRGRPDHPGDDRAGHQRRTGSRVGGEVGYPTRSRRPRAAGGRASRSPPRPTRSSGRTTRRAAKEAYLADSSRSTSSATSRIPARRGGVLADDHGNVVHLGEGDCTIQRHQKLSSRPLAGGRRRAAASGSARSPSMPRRRGGTGSAGTIEGLLDPGGSYYFLEMNTRVQVEHTITEAVTGIDIVREQLRIATGEPLSFSQSQVVMRGHAIECRINAEDVTQRVPPVARARHRLPRAGRHRRPRRLRSPRAGDRVSDLYDPLVAKLVVHDVDRERAPRNAARPRGVLDRGADDALGFHRALLSSPCFVEGGTCRG